MKRAALVLAVVLVLGLVGTTFATGVGFWMGYDGGAYKLRIGDPAGQRLDWDGSRLLVKGDLYADTGYFGSGTNDVEITESGLLAGGGNVNIDAAGINFPVDATAWLTWGSGASAASVWYVDSKLFLKSGSSIRLWPMGTDDTITALASGGNVQLTADGGQPVLGDPAVPWATTYLNPATTTDALYPLVLSSYVVKQKTDGINGTEACSAGEFVTGITAGYGIVTGVSCDTPGPLAALWQRIAQLEAEIAALKGQR